MFIEAIVTAIIVSIDGFLCGLAIGVKKNKININKLFIIGLIPIVMAIPVMLLGNYVSDLINSKISNYIGFVLFLILAFLSLIQINKEEDKKNYTNISLTSSIIIGFTIGIDSSISAFSLALNNHNPFITPFYFGLSHIVLIYSGNFIALRKKVSKIKFIEYLSPILFTILAIIKLI